MCVSCGCRLFNDDHGDPRNITMEELERAATAAGMSLDEVVEHIAEATKAGDGSVVEPDDSRQPSRGASATRRR